MKQRSHLELDKTNRKEVFNEINSNIVTKKIITLYICNAYIYNYVSNCNLC